MTTIKQSSEPDMTIIKHFKIKDRLENTVIIRIKKDKTIPIISKIEFNRNESKIIERNRFNNNDKLEYKKDKQIKEDNNSDISKELDEFVHPSFTETFTEFEEGIMLFVSGSQFLRRELSAMLSFSFSGMAEKFLKINANQVGNKRKLYSWHVLSDRKLGEFTGLLDRRAETTQFAASLPAMLIPALVAHFDTFILRTLNDILKHKPEIAKSIQKTITAQELLEFPNIEVARAALIDKDLDSRTLYT